MQSTSYVLVAGGPARAFALLTLIALFSFSQFTAAQTYVPNEDVVKSMTPREARNVLRNMGRVGVAWEQKDRFIARDCVVWVAAFTIFGPGEASLSVSYDLVNPRLEQVSGLLSGERSQLHLGTVSGRGILLYYNGSRDFETLKKVADALLVLRRYVEREFGPDSDRAFEEIAKQYRAADPKPQLPEEIRKYNVQASAAVKDRDFVDASALFEEVVGLAPWYPEGHFNYALTLGELGQVWTAVREMKRYLMLVPDAPNARAVQDKIYEWERKIRK